MKIIKSILDAVFPENFTCEVCGREVFDGNRFCADCAPKVIFNDGATCPLCGRKTELPVLCLECKAEAPLYDKAVSAFVYDLAVRALVLGYKSGKPYLKEYFADRLAPKCRQFEGVDFIAYVPMHKRDRRRRGYNQAELLAKALAKRLSLPVNANAIKKVKKTSAQKELTRRERAENLRGSFRADRGEVKGKTVLMVDDVMTTGATAEAVCRELKKRGAKKVYFATVASVEYKTQL